MRACTCCNVARDMYRPIHSYGRWRLLHRRLNSTSDQWKRLSGTTSESEFNTNREKENRQDHDHGETEGSFSKQETTASEILASAPRHSSSRTSFGLASIQIITCIRAPRPHAWALPSSPPLRQMSPPTCCPRAGCPRRRHSGPRGASPSPAGSRCWLAPQCTAQSSSPDWSWPRLTKCRP